MSCVFIYCFVFNHNTDNNSLLDNVILRKSFGYIRVVSIIWFFKTCTIICYSFTIEPQPPGPIDKKTSNFHPQTLYLKWGKSENSSYVNMYRVTIDGYARYTPSTTISHYWTLELEPGRNYTVEIEAICWYYTNYNKSSPEYTEEIQTLRKWFDVPQLK